ncbi:MAG: prepilin-type N-terminal cleavage/methylation domain-containing protein, partial [Fuerstiella sp.]
MMKLKNHRTPQSCRSAFTLVEMLIVITIVVIIMSMTLGAFSFIRSSDRVSGAAGQVQSFFAGARDRAIYSDEMRGVRLFVEPAPPGSPPGASAFSRTITSMAYIGPGGTWSGPGDSDLIDLMRVDRGNGAGGPPDGDFDDPEDQPVIKIRGKNNPGWWNLKRRGWLVDGLRIRIPAGPAGNWYTINTSLIDATAAPTNDQFLLLEIPYAFSENTPGEVARRDQTYEIELPARILPQEPMLMPDGVVIDLDGSSVPNVWRPASTGNSLYSGYMDV